VAEEDTPLSPEEERVLAEKLGLQYHHLPISLDNSMRLGSKSCARFSRTPKGWFTFIGAWVNTHARFRSLLPA
jgi:hypothetical protein